MAEPGKSRRGESVVDTPFYRLAFIVLLVAVFYFARDVLLPFALAVLLSFMLAPVAKRLEKWRFGRIGSVTVTVALAFAVIAGVGFVVARQVIDLADKLPNYQETLVQKVRSLRSTSEGVLARPAETIETLQKEIAKPEKGSSAKQSAKPDAKVSDAKDTVPPGKATPPKADTWRKFVLGDEPIAVRFVDTTFLPVRVLQNIAPLFAPLGLTAVVVVFVVFMLIEREDLRDRLIRLAGTGRVHLTTQALNDAARRLSRYLLMQLVINTVFGIAVGAGLYLLGLPNAALWGLLATLLRFLPYVGPVLAAMTPLALSLAVFDDWTRPLLAAGWFVLVELIINSVLEPLLYGSSIGVSTVGIVATVVFWTWLWGPVGMVLATPLTVCVTVLAKHLPQFGFLNILLAEEPPLELRFRFYQRLLAQDYDEARAVAADFLKTGTREELYETLLVPALVLAERDRDAGRLSENQENFIYESVDELLDELDEDQSASTGEAQATSCRGSLRVLCIPTEDEADRVAGVMLAQLLASRGHEAKTLESPGIDAETFRRIEEDKIDCVVISTIAPGDGFAFRARNLCRRLRRRFPQLKIIIGMWHARGQVAETREHVTPSGADGVTTSLTRAVELVHEVAADSKTPLEENANGDPTKDPQAASEDGSPQPRWHTAQLVE